MVKKLKVFLYNENVKTLTSSHRPFHPTTKYEVVVVEDVEDADFILCKPTNYNGIIVDSKFNSKLNKVVVYANDDNPNYLLKDDLSIKLIAQPLCNQETLNSFNADTIPLLMTDHEIIHLDKEFLEKCRDQEKIYDYYFAGQIYGNRQKILDINLPNTLIRTTGSIYGLNPEQKLQQIKDFLMELGKAKFGFTPRGVGSNSFRLYEALMVGTIPIATDVITYPYENIVDWDSFSIRGTLNNITDLINRSKDINYESVRQNGIEFWENYCKINILHDNILDKIIS